MVSNASRTTSCVDGTPDIELTFAISMDTFSRRGLVMMRSSLSVSLCLSLYLNVEDLDLYSIATAALCHCDAVHMGRHHLRRSLMGAAKEARTCDTYAPR